jgi:tRNA-dihydrouridine synthase
MSIRELLNKKNVVGLSPMDGVTDEAFRLVQTQIAKPDVTFTEFVSAEGLSRGGVKLYDTLLYSESERPIIAQLFGKDPESFYKSAIVCCELGFDGVDINMGCPAKTVTQHGSGAALIGKPELAAELIQMVKKGVDDWFNERIGVENLGLNQKTLEVIKRNKNYSGTENRTKVKPTVSVKTRLGITENIIDSWIPHLLSQEIDFLTIHGRTLKQGYSGTADWETIKKVADMGREYNTFVFGNGDIKLRSQVKEFCDKYNVSGVLIGRNTMGNPWAFTDHIPTAKDRFSAMLLHAQIYDEVFPHRCFDSLRKHFLFYSYGLKNAKNLRAKIVRINSVEDLLALEDEFVNC